MQVVGNPNLHVRSKGLCREHAFDVGPEVARFRPDRDLANVRLYTDLKEHFGIPWEVRVFDDVTAARAWCED